MGIIIRVNRKNIKTVISKAAEVLKGGGVVAYPTETFYALGAKYDSEGALKRVFALKGRAAGKAMPLIVGDEEALRQVARGVNEAARRLMDKYWPGPLSILFPAAGGLSSYIKYGGKVAARVPGESFALRLAGAAGFPITATSANPAGRPPAEDAETVSAYFGRDVDLIIDGGRTQGGLPSTIVDVKGGKLRVVRRGRVEIKKVT